MNLKKKNAKEKKKKFMTLSLKPKHGLRGIWRKSLNLDALSQLVGSLKFFVRYMGE